MPQLDASTLFHSLAGTWHLRRTLTSTNTSDLQGTCTGSATYSPRPPSVFIDREGQLRLAAAEMLYHERGKFEMHPTHHIAGAGVVKVPFERKYIWRLSKAGVKSEISVWFTKPGSEEIDYLFHDLLVQTCETMNDGIREEVVEMAELSGGHVCVEDFYASTYSFTLTEGQVRGWNVIHEVQGPKKDQTIETTFAKPQEVLLD